MGDPSRDYAGDFQGNCGLEPASFRGAQRQEKIAARMAMADDEHARASAAIEGRLAGLLAALSPRRIAFCWPLRREFDCRPLVVTLLANGWQACQPVVVAPAAAMEFRAWAADAPMTTDRYGIPIPDTAASPAPDVVLLPLVAFDDQGFRLGYGGGYFDRTLAALSPRPLAVGVGFELTRLPSVRPQAHDIRLDAIVTEAGVMTFGARLAAGSGPGR